MYKYISILYEKNLARNPYYILLFFDEKSKYYVEMKIILEVCKL